MEIWKSVKNLEHLYEVSNIGRVRNKNTQHILKGGINQVGYKQHVLCDGDTRITRCAHRIVAEVFCDNPNNVNHVNHKNGRKLDNRANNLEWVTPKENVHHAIEKGYWNNITYNRKPIQNITTGKIYKSAAEAADDVHREIPTSKWKTIMINIKACCAGKQPTAYKYKWKDL